MSVASLTVRSVVTGLLAASLALSAPLAAIAADPTEIRFAPATAVSSAFGERWVVGVAVSTSNEYTPSAPVKPSDGTVDIYIKGFAGAYAVGLPIQPDGKAYFAQPDDKPLLGAGEYEVTAVFMPAAGSNRVTSQTSSPLSLTITSVALTSSVEVLQDAAVSASPIVVAALGGDYVKSNGGAPSGTWAITVTDSEGAMAFEREYAVEHGSTEPLRVEIDSALAKGETFTVAASFTPVEELAAGLTVAPAPTASFTTPGSTFADTLASRLPFPWWLVIALGVILVGLVATVIVLGIKLSRRGRDDDPAAPASARVPGDPGEVDLMTWREAGIPDDSSVPIPESTTWLLSDIEPDIEDPREARVASPADAPTERIETPPSTDERPDVSPETDEKPTDGHDKQNS